MCFKFKQGPKARVQVVRTRSADEQLVFMKGQVKEAIKENILPQVSGTKSEGNFFLSHKGSIITHAVQSSLNILSKMNGIQEKIASMGSRKAAATFIEKKPTQIRQRSLLISCSISIILLKNTRQLGGGDHLIEGHEEIGKIEVSTTSQNV